MKFIFRKSFLLSAFAILILIVCSFNRQDKKELKIVDLRIVDSKTVAFDIINKCKSNLLIFSLKQNPNKKCKLLLCNPKTHQKERGWTLRTPFLGPGDFDSTIVRPGEKECFYLTVDTQKVDTVVGVTSFKILQKKSDIKKSYYLCLTIQNSAVKEFKPDFEIIEMLNLMDPNTLNNRYPTR